MVYSDLSGELSSKLYKALNDCIRLIFKTLKHIIYSCYVYIYIYSSTGLGCLGENKILSSLGLSQLSILEHYGLDLLIFSYLILEPVGLP